MNYRYKILDKTVAYQGFFRLERYRLRHQLFAGGWSADLTRECLERGDAVAVLPYDPVRDTVLLLEQFRVGALRAPDGPWLLEIVAGMMKPDEDPRAVAKREMLEETGCALLDLVAICDYLVSPGGTTETVHLFCGWVDSSRAGGIHGLAGEHEDIRVHVFPRQEAMELLASGRIISSPPIIALQWLEMHRQELLRRWRRRPAAGISDP
ncbi:MAG TPA: NUDIX domain-containing protein [Candidatus Competibacteraceae bacterium]|nr:NUDIX domain-containing protein [Candidatus Competibacteraceae bacterium]